MRIHNKEKPFSCSICKLKSFAQRSQLNDHVNNVHFSISNQQENKQVFQKPFPGTHSEGAADSTEDNEATTKECPLTSIPLATSIVGDVAEELRHPLTDDDDNLKLEDNTKNKKHLNLDVVWGNKQLHSSHDIVSSKEKSKDRGSIEMKEDTLSNSDIMEAKEDASNLSESKW